MLAADVRAIMDSTLIPGDPITELQPTCDHTWSVAQPYWGKQWWRGKQAPNLCFCKQKLSWNSSNASCDVIWATILGRFSSIWLVVWNICYFSILGMSSSQLTSIFQRDWNHQPASDWIEPWAHENFIFRAWEWAAYFGPWWVNFGEG